MREQLALRFLFCLFLTKNRESHLFSVFSTCYLLFNAGDFRKDVCSQW